ncbi:MAG TPA: hypothetical protein VN956_12695 [Pyrinomonadaceae bacterium]|nr:hypothetical protein [Pyrinomonadaceae bacterium]
MQEPESRKSTQENITSIGNTDRISFAIVLVLAHLAAYLFIKYDDKRIEAEVKESAIHNGHT